MLLSDILKIPGKRRRVPQNLLHKVAGHRGSPGKVRGVGYRLLAEHAEDRSGKWGAEVGVLRYKDTEVALCRRGGKYGDEWKILVLDEESYLDLYCLLARYSPDFKTVPPSTDLWRELTGREVDMLSGAGVKDSRPFPDRAEDYGHLYHLLHMRGSAENVDVTAIHHPKTPFIAMPVDFVLKVVKELRNVQATVRSNMVELTLTDIPC